jgi:hypothetical protein
MVRVREELVKLKEYAGVQESGAWGKRFKRGEGLRGAWG